MAYKIFTMKKKQCLDKLLRNLNKKDGDGDR